MNTPQFVIEVIKMLDANLWGGGASPYALCVNFHGEDHRVVEFFDTLERAHLVRSHFLECYEIASNVGFTLVTDSTDVFIAHPDGRSVHVSHALVFDEPIAVFRRELIGAVHKR